MVQTARRQRIRSIEHEVILYIDSYTGLWQPAQSHSPTLESPGSGKVKGGGLVSARSL